MEIIVFQSKDAFEEKVLHLSTPLDSKPKFTGKKIEKYTHFFSVGD